MSVTIWQRGPQIHTGLSSGTITLCEVTSLDHEVLDDTVEGRTLITVALLTSSQSPEVLGGYRSCLSIETNDNTAHRLITVVDIEIDLVGDLWSLDSLN